MKNGEIALFRVVRKGEQVKVLDLKPCGVMTRGSVGLKAVKFE